MELFEFDQFSLLTFLEICIVIYQFSLLATQYLSFFILLVNVEHKLRMQRMLLLFGLDLTIFRGSTQFPILLNVVYYIYIDTVSYSIDFIYSLSDGRP